MHSLARDRLEMARRKVSARRSTGGPRLRTHLPSRTCRWYSASYVPPPLAFQHALAGDAREMTDEVLEKVTAENLDEIDVVELLWAVDAATDAAADGGEYGASGGASAPSSTAAAARARHGAFAAGAG